ncbi:DUF4178 domain-containing protein [Snodgrassella sp. W8158]|uniref:DUF4178 domain-containing protein n=1 Tax=Snodgrassella sp. W8158 TaxID=2751018 RepID=UPI0018DCDEF3|nr:DUF4178 domain-containing protein [Snodgrassella sp. W8158]MBI0182153.1 DUF4178 domain-containing protein [Snodgrassella sp. W8158]
MNSSSSYLLHTSCPSCGAEIGIRSATAVTAVCGYCHSVLLVNQNKLLQSGRHSAVLNDLSPLQIGTTGKWQGKSFILIGRIQVHYEAGLWNEWHALLEDGSSAWLSETNDRFAFTRLQPASAGEEKLPEFSSLKVGKTFFKYQSRRYAVADIHKTSRGQYVAEGELPVSLPNSETALVADCRNGLSFITLDYSSGQQQPEVFAGRGVTLKSLKLQNTRRKEQIRSQAGYVKGSTKRGKCPSCGGEILWVSGVTDYVLCQYCHGQMDMSEDAALQKNVSEKREWYERQLTIKIGSKARINNEDWWVLGAMILVELPVQIAFPDVPLYVQVMREETEEEDGLGWTEYLLYSPRKGFLWLLELENNQWAMASTLDDWPILNGPLQPLDLKREDIPFLYDYAAHVMYAAGAFYWQVAPGDRMYYIDYGCKAHKLSTTLTDNEQSWSVVSTIPASLVAAWFQNDKNISIKAKPLERDKAIEIVREHQGIKAKDFNADNIRKWSRQTFINSLFNIYNPNFWIALFVVLNLPVIFIILVGGPADYDYGIDAVLVFILAFSLLSTVPKLKTRQLNKTRKYNIYIAAILLIAFTWIDYAAHETDTNSSGGHYYSSSGRWHK